MPNLSSMFAPIALRTAHPRRRLERAWLRSNMADDFSAHWIPFKHGAFGGVPASTSACQFRSLESRQLNTGFTGADQQTIRQATAQMLIASDHTKATRVAVRNRVPA